MQYQREAVTRREIVHQPRQFPEDGIDILTDVLERDVAKSHFKGQRNRLHLEDEMPQEQFAEILRTPSSPGENQQS